MNIKETKERQIFHWKGINTKGEPISGTLESTHLVLAKNHLLLQEIRQLKIKPRHHAPSIYFQKKITAKEITEIIRQLSMMIHAGIPLFQSLQIMTANIQHPTLRQLIAEIQQHIEGGFSLAEAFRQFPKYFNGLFCQFIEIGERTGRLEWVLNQLITYREANEKMQQQLIKALTYPLFVLLFAIVITLGLLLGVVPQFQHLFHAMGSNLPPMTLWIIYLSDITQQHGILGITCISMIIMIFYLLKNRFPMVSQCFARLLLSTPIVGGIIKKASLARFCRTLSMTYSTGIPLLEALSFISGVMNHKLYRHATDCLRDKISLGQSLPQAMTQINAFPTPMISMVSIGDESGHIDTMLLHIADRYESELRLTIEEFSNLLEPVIMVIVGILVGGLIIGMYLPIFKMGSLL